MRVGAAVERDGSEEGAAAPRLDWRDVVAPIIPVAITLLAFRGIPAVYFLGDDFVHLIDVVNNGLADTVWRPFMGHLYALPTLVYWALWRMVGMNAAVFLGFTLAVHLVSVGLFYALAAALTGGRRGALLAATLWGSWPFHSGTLAWFCVHGHAVAGLALLLALLGLARAARTRRPVTAAQAALWAVLLVAASTGFGTALGVAVVFPFAARICVGRRLGTVPLAILIGGGCAVAVLYVAIHWLYPTSLGPRPSPAVAASLADPLRVARTLLSLAHVGLSRLTTHVWWWPSRHGSPAELGFGIAAALLLGAGLALAGAARRRWLAGLLLLAAAAYAAVAVGRAHVQQQMMFGSVAFAAMPRYHYLASIPLALCLMLSAATLFGRVQPSAAVGNALTVTVLALLLIMYSRTRWIFGFNGATRAETAAVLQEAALAAAAAPPGATVYIADRRFNFANIWDRGYTSAGIFTLFNASGEIDGRTIRYLPDPRWSPSAPPAGSRLERLLVPWPPQCRDEPWTPAQALSREGEGRVRATE